MRTPEKSVAYTPVFSTKNKCIYNNNNNNNNNSDLKLIKSDFCVTILFLFSSSSLLSLLLLALCSFQKSSAFNLEDMRNK